LSDWSIIKWHPVSCQICRSMSLRDMGIINHNPTTNPNPKTLTLILTVPVTEEINIK